MNIVSQRLKTELFQWCIMLSNGKCVFLLHRTGIPGFRVVPWGLRRLLNYVKEKYNNPPVYIMGNGYGETSGDVQDADRVSHVKDYLQAVLKGHYQHVVYFTADSFKYLLLFDISLISRQYYPFRHCCYLFR